MLSFGTRLASIGYSYSTILFRPLTCFGVNPKPIQFGPHQSVLQASEHRPTTAASVSGLKTPLVGGVGGHLDASS